MQVTCWCDTVVLRLPATMVLAGQTASCNRPGCLPPAGEAEPAGLHRVRAR